MCDCTRTCPTGNGRGHPASSRRRSSARESGCPDREGHCASKQMCIPRRRTALRSFRPRAAPALPAPRSRSAWGACGAANRRGSRSRPRCPSPGLAMGSGCAWELCGSRKLGDVARLRRLCPCPYFCLGRRRMVEWPLEHVRTDGGRGEVESRTRTGGKTGRRMSLGRRRMGRRIGLERTRTGKGNAQGAPVLRSPREPPQQAMPWYQPSSSPTRKSKKRTSS